MPVSVKTTGTIKINLETLAKQIAPLILGRVLERTARGVGSDGKPFHDYAARTVEQYGLMGESTAVDLRLTGGMLNSLALKRTTIGLNGSLSLVFGPDAGTSPQVRPPTKGRARASRTGTRGPPHNIVGMWIHAGNPATHMPARPWLGLSDADRVWLRGVMQKAGIFTR